MDPVALSIEETCRVLGGIGRTKVWELIRDQKLRTLKVGSRTLVKTDSIRELASGESV